LKGIFSSNIQEKITSSAMSIDFKSIQITTSETHMIYFYKSTIQTSFWKRCVKKNPRWTPQLAL
jgi:hypothetical protein